MAGKTKRPTRDQARAWLNGILFPLIEALGREAYHLRNRNPTWRFYAKRCEHLRPIEEYVDRGQLPNLKQFFRYYPAIRDLSARRDAALDELEEAAAALHATLAAFPELAVLSTRLEQSGPEWRGAYSIDQGPALIAVHAVNWAAMKPPECTASVNWAAYRAEALALRDRPLARPLVARIEAAIDHFAELDGELQRELTGLRDDLSDKHGLPAVPAGAGQDGL